MTRTESTDVPMAANKNSSFTCFLYMKPEPSLAPLILERKETFKQEVFTRMMTAKHVN